MPEEIEIENQVETVDKPKLPRKGEVKPALPKKKSTSEESSLNLKDGGKEPQIDYSNNFFTKNQFDEPEIELEDGVKLPVNKRVIPVTPYANPDDYVLDVQQRIKAGTKTPQDEKFIQNVRKSNRNFTPDDDISLSTISHKYSLPSEFPDVDSKITAVTQLKDMLLKKQMEEDTQYGGTGSGLGLQTVVRNAGKLKGDKLEEFERLTELQDKLKTEKQKTDTYPVYFDAAVRTDQSGNLLKKAMAGIALINPNTSAQGQIAISQQAVDHLEKLPVEFSMGLNGLKYTEPEQYKRVTKMLSNGEPLSETMVATITAQGLDAKEAIVKDGLVAGDLTPQQYKKETDKIQEVRYNNIVGNKETLRAFLSSGIANIADDIESEKSGLPHEEVTKSIFGHTWNYSDAEIDQYGKTFAQANGIDPNDARVKEAIKYLQDNEGAMIMENSIAKTGAVRDLAKGLATPIRGVYNTVEGLTKTDAERYTEGQSQGNVNVSEQRLSRIKNNSVSDAVSDVLEGTGQFLTQAGMAAATSGLIGTAAKGLMASQLGATTAGELVGTAPKIGKMIMGSKDALSTVITSYAQSYDGNLKQAYTYTADDDKARATAGIMSGLEGATELFLSPLDIAKGIGNKLFNKKKLSKSVVDVLSDAAITDKSAAIKNILKSTLKGSLETGKVISAEIGEEEVTQIADYAANAILNPQSKTFQDRDLSAEIVNTAYQTGLSMVVPALASGAGAYKVNNFSKGSLLIAAQNRQQLIDDMKKRVHNGNMSQDEFNEKAEIINTAAKANDILPVKDNGKTLSTTEKANYVYSRVSEAILNKKLKVLEEDKSRSAGKIGEGEEATNVQDPEIVQLKKKIEAQVKYRTDILSLRPQYYVDNEPVSKQEFNEKLNSDKADKYDFAVENDNKTQEKLREIGGKDQKVKDETVVEKKEEKTVPVEEKVAVKEEPVLDIEEEVPQQVQPSVSPLQSNLQAARSQAQTMPVTEATQPAAVAPVVPALSANLEAARTNATVGNNTAEQADKRAKELLGEKVPAVTVPSLGSNLETVRQQQQQRDLELQQSAAKADARVQQMKLDKIPMTEAATNAIAKMDKVKGKKLGIYRDVAKNNPKGFLKEVAQQARGILANGQADTKNAMKQAVDNYTQDVVNVALEMFPVNSREAKYEVATHQGKKVYSINSASKFHEAIEKAMGKRTADRLQADIHPVEYYQNILDNGGELYLSEDGSFGSFITASGYMGSLFKSPDAKVSNVVGTLVKAAMKHGDVFFDAYSTHLEDIYIKNGFRPVARIKFKAKYAPKGWKDSTLKDKPDVVFFAYDPNGKYKKGEGKYFEDWDKAFIFARDYKPSTNETANGRTESTGYGTGKEAVTSSENGSTATQGTVGGTNTTGDNEGQGSDKGTSGSNVQPAHVNNSTTTQDFFSQTVKGANQPKVAWTPLLPIQGALKKAYDIWQKFRGSFDAHIETNIPAFRDVQIRKINAIAESLPDGGLVVDLGGSEGGFGKTLTSLNPKIKTINLDMNPDMEAAHNSNPVAGADFVKAAFGEDVPLDDGTVVKRYDPKEKADVVHESMMFQFIMPEREDFINEIADNYIKPNGVVILEEKVVTPEWKQNEDNKDQNFKPTYYDNAAIAKKQEQVVAGMKNNQAHENDLLDALSKKFKYVYQYWDAGNFKGYIASNDEAAAKNMLEKIGNTTTAYTSREKLVAIENGVEENVPENKVKEPSGVQNNPSNWRSNIEALVHPETGLGVTVKKILDEQQPLKDAFLKRIGLSIEDYRKLDEAGKDKVQQQWVKSNEFNELQKQEPSGVSSDVKSEEVKDEKVFKIYPELKDTKVVNDDGSPKIVYHGGRNFDRFKIPESEIDKGIYFTDNPELALYFAHQAELVERDKRGDDYSDVPNDILESGEPFPEKYLKYAKLHKAYLDMKNPKIVDAIDAASIPKNYEKDKDGFIAKTTGDFGYSGGQYVVFDPQQIKKADLKAPLQSNQVSIEVSNQAKSENKPIQSEQAKEAEVKEGDTIILPSQVNGGIPRTMIFKEGEWQQQVGGLSTKVGANVQALAQQRFEQESKVLPDIAIDKEQVELFNAIEKALSIAGKKNQQMALERLYEGKNAKYTKEQVDTAIAINKNFDNIVKDMNKDGLLTKECPT